MLAHPIVTEISLILVLATEYPRVQPSLYIKQVDLLCKGYQYSFCVHVKMKGSLHFTVSCSTNLQLDNDHRLRQGDLGLLDINYRIARNVGGVKLWRISENNEK